MRIVVPLARLLLNASSLVLSRPTVALLVALLHTPFVTTQAVPTLFLSSVLAASACCRAVVAFRRPAAAARATGIATCCLATSAATALLRSHVCIDTPSLRAASSARAAACRPHVCAHTVSLHSAVAARTAPCRPCAAVTCRPAFAV